MRRLTLLVAFVVAPVLNPLHGQSRVPVRTGSEIRVETTGDRVFRGALLDGSADSIRLRQANRDSVIAVPLAAVRSYSVLRTDRQRGANRGFLIGGGVALGLVAVLTAANAGDDDISVHVGLIAALPAALVGGGIGATVGAALAPSTWGESVYLQASRTGGFGLGLARRF